ncbi:MAG: hypothetical protein ACPGTQ_15945 [Colwellia sp.]|jgi:hypothetical protein
MEQQVCYNILSAVGTKHHQIVYHDATNTNDGGELARVTPPLIQQALNLVGIIVLAEKGYYCRKDMKATLDLEANNINLKKVH